MIRAEVEMRGFDAQIRRLVAYDRNAEQKMRDAAEQATDNLVPAWKQVAPYETGAYQQSISGRVRRLVGGEVVAIIGTPMKSSRGFPYPAALEESTRYHYRRTRFRGQETANKVRDMFKNRLQSLKRVFERAVDDIMEML